MKLYYHPISTPSLYPVFVAHASGVEHEAIVVDLKRGEQHGETFKAVNPFGKVPAMVADGIAMGESSAIGRYIARLSGSDIYSEDLREAALIDQWVEFVVHQIRLNVSRLQFHRFIAPMLGEATDEAVIAQGEKALAQYLPHVEVALTGDGHLQAERLTIADIALVAALEPETTAKLDLAAFPVLREWLGGMREADWYQAVHTHYGAEIGLLA